MLLSRMCLTFTADSQILNPLLTGNHVHTNATKITKCHCMVSWHGWLNVFDTYITYKKNVKWQKKNQENNQNAFENASNLLINSVLNVLRNKWRISTSWLILSDNLDVQEIQITQSLDFVINGFDIITASRMLTQVTDAEEVFVTSFKTGLFQLVSRHSWNQWLLLILSKAASSETSD